MQSRAANRLYSNRSLKRWSERLSVSWEERFDEAALLLGRKLYKSGAVKELSVEEDAVIVTCKFGKVESYSVVEWEPEHRLKVRSSVEDQPTARAMAIAGLLELEELIADEDLSLLRMEASAEEPISPAQGDEAPVSEAGAEASPPVVARVLRLSLSATREGLALRAYWLAEDGSRTPAVGKGSTNGAENAEERGRLIVLAARARKAHFVYDEALEAYALRHAREIPHFASRVWPQWKKDFSTEEDETIALIGEREREVELSAEAALDERGGLDLKWVFGSGRSLLSEEEAALLADAGPEPVLLPRRGLVTLSPRARGLLRQWRELSGGNGRPGRLAPYQLFSLFPEGEVQAELKGRIRQWRDAIVGNQGEEPIKLIEQLRPYQRAGALWMDRLLSNGCHCLLADEMGLGKTVQVISLLRARMEAGQKALVVCPASVAPVWISEFAKFAPRIRAVKYEGRGLLQRPDSWDVLVASFAQARNRIERLETREFEFITIDEAQFIKNPDAKATRACLQLRGRRRIALTGTPIENRPLDLWPAFEFLMPGLLGPRRGFERAFQENPGAFKERLKRQIAPFMLRRTKAAVAEDLPGKMIIDQRCEISRRQAAVYAGICEEGLRRLGSDLGSALRENRFATLSLLTRLRQASCDPHLLPWVEAPIEESGKLMALLEKLIEVLGTGHKVVVFSQFVRFLRRVRLLLETSFPELPVFEITGATRDRAAPVQAFQQCGETAAMLASLRAAGSGITLHAADYVFLLDPWWNPAVESQAIDRVHRIGQRNSVIVYRLIARGTIEERIHELQSKKRELFDSLIQDSAAGAEELVGAVDSLESLLALR